MGGCWRRQSGTWPRRPDVALAAAFALVAEVELRVSSQNILTGTASRSADSVLVLLPVLALCWRRSAPFAATVALAAAITVTGAALGASICFFGGLLPFLVTLYSASAWSRAPFARLAALVPFALLAPLPLYVPTFRFPGDLVFAGVVSATAWTVGQLVRRWRLQSEQLLTAVQAVEHSRDAQARLAVVEERSRIARELHDVVAHGMSVMVMQAGLARLDLHQQPGVADEALRTVERVGRQSLLEMRRLLGLLRAPEPAELQAQPRLRELPQLLEGFRQAGLSVEATVQGDEAVLGEAQELSAYRIVQEALTNALKHGAQGRASVAVEYLSCGVGITVTNPVDPAAPCPAEGGGHGLIGIKERVALFGGSCATGVRGSDHVTEVLLPFDRTDT